MSVGEMWCHIADILLDVILTNIWVPGDSQHTNYIESFNFQYETIDIIN